MHLSSRLCLFINSIQILMACDQPPTPKAQATPPSIPMPATDEPGIGAPQAAQPKTVEIPTTKIHSLEFDAARFPQELPPGEVLGGLAFVDSAGENHVVFARTEVGNEDHIHTSVLRIKHVVRHNEVVREVRSFTERIDGCDADIFLDPHFGEWSVSDVNNNGIGELSFGYTAACVSDVSPLGHKVFVTEGGQKYALRGQTYLQFPDEPAYGGEYTAEKMPPAFLEKAKQVWELTARR